MKRLKKQKACKRHKPYKTKKNGNGIEDGRKLAAAMKAIGALRRAEKEASNEVHQS